MSQRTPQQLEAELKEVYQVLAARNGDVAAIKNSCRQMVYAARAMIRALPATMSAEQRAAFEQANKVLEELKRLGVNP